MDELIEVLAEGSHRSWMAEKQRQGFADHGWMSISDRPQQCAGLPHFVTLCGLPKERHRPDMLPYADLAENVKEYDRATVRGVLANIKAAGYCVVKNDD